MNEIRALYAKGSGIAKGASIASCCEPVSKCMAESYSTSKKKNHFRERLELFSTQLYQKSIWAMLTRGKCKFLGE